MPRNSCASAADEQQGDRNWRPGAGECPFTDHRGPAPVGELQVAAVALPVVAVEAVLAEGQAVATAIPLSKVRD